MSMEPHHYIAPNNNLREAMSMEPRQDTHPSNRPSSEESGGQTSESSDDTRFEVLLRKASCGDVDFLKGSREDRDDRLLLGGKDRHGYTALHWASRYGHAEFVDEVLHRWRASTQGVDGHGADMLLEVNDKGDTAAHEAIRNKHVVVAVKLLEADSRLANHDNYEGESLLYLAAERGLKEVVHHLLGQSGASHEGPGGTTALHAAVKSGAPVIVELLLKERSQLNQISSPRDGGIPLHLAAYLGEEKIVKKLIEKEEDRSLVYNLNEDGNTPIHMAAKAGHLTVMRVLIKACPDGGAMLNKCRRNALHLAIQYERTNVVKYILQDRKLKGLVCERDKDGNGPLHLAALHWNLQILHALLADKGVDKLARNCEGHTALDVFLNNEQTDDTSTLQWFDAQSQLREAIPHLPKAENNEQMELRNTLKLNQKAQRMIQSKVKKEIEHILTLAAVVATVTFAAAFTVPGGFGSDSGPQPGLPILLREAAFKVFIVSDAVTMTSSLAAMFLCVYATWDDIDTVIPHRRVIRLMMLFSFAGMSMAFASGMYTILAPEALWLAILVCAMCGSLPFVSLVWAKSFFLKLRCRHVPLGPQAVAPQVQLKIRFEAEDRFPPPSEEARRYRPPPPGATASPSLSLPFPVVCESVEASSTGAIK